VYSLSKLLLAIAHEQFGPEPGFGLCLVQSAMIYSGPVLLMASGCAFALQFHLTVLFYLMQYSGKINRESKWITIAPVILYVAITAALLIAGAVHPENVHRSSEQVYCHLVDNIGTYTVSIFSVIFAIGAIALEYKSGKLLYLHWKQKDELLRQSKGAVSFSVMIRLASFSMISILSVTTCALYLLPNIKKFDDILLFNTVLPNIAVILLGLNMSVIRAWMFWKKKSESGQDEPSRNKVTTVESSEV